MNDTERTKLGEITVKMDRKEIRGISIDSRTIREGELFVAIRGDRFDGHDFVPDVMKKGAWGALVEQTVLENNFARLGGLRNILPVDNTLTALQEMAALHRKKFAVPVVGITGSNGKTTTKEMLAAILKRKGPVLKNEGNLNNHIGVPLTLLKLTADHRSAVIEMGMSALGEIDLLARLTGPTVGVITNIGPAHLEFLKSTDTVAQAKGELLLNLRSEGTAVLNADDPYYPVLAKKFAGRIITFGFDARAQVGASDIAQGRDFTDFILSAEGSRVQVRLRTVGRHNIANALAAAAAAIAVAVPLDVVKHGLDDFVPVAMRSELRQVQGRTVLADCYNANPASMEAALEALVSLRTGGRTFAVIGDMLELGNESPRIHRAIGERAARLRVDVLITTGELARNAAAAAREAGMKREQVHEADTPAAAAALLKRLSRPGDAVLIKGSRGMKMEKVLEEF